MILYVSILSIILSALVAINNWKVNRSSIFLSLILIIISVFTLNQYFLNEQGSAFWLAVIFNNFAPFWYLAGPLLFWYTRALTKDKIRFYRSDLLHLIPFTIHFIGNLPYLFSPFTYKLEIAQQLLQNSANLKTISLNWIIPLEVNLIVRPTLMMLYALHAIQMFNRRIRNQPLEGYTFTETHGDQIKRWFFTFTGILLLLSLNYLIAGIQFSTIESPTRGIYELPVALLNSFLIAILPILLLVFPNVIYGLPRSPKSNTKTDSSNGIKKVLTPTADPLQSNSSYFQEVAEKITQNFENEKPFLNVDYSIEDLAESLDIPRHHIYYCLNSVIGKKFTTLKTIYRVQHAQKLLLGADLSRFTIDSIGLESGFASRSNFYSAFKEVTGLTPTEFLAQNGKAVSTTKN